MWWILLVLGIFAFIAIWMVQRRNWRIGTRIASASCSIVLFVSFAIYVGDRQLFLGDDNWYDISPGREIIFYLLMLFGMFVRVLSKAIEARRKGMQSTGVSVGLDLDIWEIAYPFLFSVITFTILLAEVGDQPIGWMTASLAFQTGFFWQTLLKKE